MFSNDVGLFKEAKKGRIGGLISSLIMCYVLFAGGMLLGTRIIVFLSRFLPQESLFTKLIGSIIASSTVIILIAIWVKVKEKRKFSTLGFTADNFLGKYLFGFLIGLIIFSLVVLILKLTGHIVVDPNNTVLTGEVALSGIFFAIPAWIFQSASEEILTRGWLMHVLGAKYNVALGLIVSASFFGILHLTNPGITVISVANIILIGIFFGLYIIKSRSLWGACGIHAAWNWAQGNIYGFEVSGNKSAAGSILGYKLVGPSWFTGGDFGPEAGLAATIIIVIGIIIVLFVNRKKYHG